MSDFELLWILYASGFTFFGILAAIVEIPTSKSKKRKTLNVLLYATFWMLCVVAELVGSFREVVWFFKNIGWLLRLRRKTDPEARDLESRFF